MLKEKWNTGLRKGLIISLSVLLMSSFVFSFGTKKVEAAQAVNLTSTHFYVTLAKADNSNQLVISWSPRTFEPDTFFVDRITIILQNGNTDVTSIRLIIAGTDHIEIQNTTTFTGATLTTNNGWSRSTEDFEDFDLLLSALQTINSDVALMQDDVADIDSYIHYIYNQIYTMNNSGIALKNYDIQLHNVAALSYFAGCQGEVVSDTNAFTNAETLFFDYPIMLGYQNIDPTTSKSLYMYPGKEYIFIVVWNRTSALFNSNNYTFDVMSGYETPTMKRSYQNTLASTTIVNAMVLNPTTDYARFTIDWSSTFVNYLNSYQYIPLYFGPLDQCPDEYLQLLNAGFSAEEQAGTTSEDIDDVNTEFNSQVSEIDNIQNDLEDDFQTNIQAIDTDLDFEESFGQKFVTSALWVRTQFETLTTQTPYGSILFFALTLGLALMIIGRVI